MNAEAANAETANRSQRLRATPQNAAASSGAPWPGALHAAGAACQHGDLVAARGPDAHPFTWPEALERRADTGEISAVTSSAEYARELAQQDRETRDYLLMLEREAYSTAEAFARSLKG